MKARRWGFAAILALPLVACSIGRPVRQPTMYLIEPPLAESRPVPQWAQTVRVGFVRVAPAYSSSALVYRLDDFRYEADPYHSFMTDPAAMLASGMALWLERTGAFAQVIPPGSGQSAPYVLEITVGSLYGDFRSGRPPEAVLSIQFMLIDQTEVRPKVAYERNLESRVVLASASPEALVQGYGKAVADILAQLASDLSVKLAP